MKCAAKMAIIQQYDKGFTWFNAIQNWGRYHLMNGYDWLQNKGNSYQRIFQKLSYDKEI